jgi:phosphoglycolate phosphatase-like HAD superfamily hydrolase
LAGLLRERPELLDQACELYEHKFFGGTFVQSLTYVNGANQLLNRLHPKYTLAIATGAHPKVLGDQVMPKFHVPNVFAQIISGYDIDDPDKQKPHPHMLETIMAAQHSNPAETIFVGDAASDVKMAHSAGVEPVVVLTGHLNREQAEALEVRHIIPDVAKLESILQ